jgi:DNA-binding NtrC family response regulator
MAGTDLAEKRILIVDPDQRALGKLKAILVEEGYKVAAARTAREGLSSVGKHAFDVIISDLMLPDMNGLDLLSQIKGKDPDAIVLLMGTDITAQTIREAAHRGAHDLLYKFFVASSISQKLKRLLDLTRKAEGYAAAFNIGLEGVPQSDA